MSVDLLPRLADVDVAAGEQPDATRAATLDARLLQLTLEEPRPRPAMPQAHPRVARSPRRRLAVGGMTAVAVACGLTALVGLPGGGAPVGPVIPASAAGILARAATAADGPGTGPWAYVRRLGYVSHMRPEPDGQGGSFVTVVPTVEEQWLAADGHGVTRTKALVDQAVYPTAADRRSGDQAGPVRLFSDEPIERSAATVAGIPARSIPELPTDPAALRVALEAAGATSDPALLQRSALLFGSPLTPEPVRVALGALLRSLPGARVAGPITDPRGRSGTALEFTGDAWDVLLLFDDASGRLLGIRSTGKQELPGRTIQDWSLTLETGRREQAPEGRVASDLPIVSSAAPQP